MNLLTVMIRFAARSFGLGIFGEILGAAGLGADLIGQYIDRKDAKKAEKERKKMELLNMMINMAGGKDIPAPGNPIAAPQMDIGGALMGAGQLAAGIEDRIRVGKEKDFELAMDAAKAGGEAPGKYTETQQAALDATRQKATQETTMQQQLFNSQQAAAQAQVDKAASTMQFQQDQLDMARQENDRAAKMWDAEMKATETGADTEYQAQVVEKAQTFRDQAIKLRALKDPEADRQAMMLEALADKMLNIEGAPPAEARTLESYNAQ